MKNFPVTAGLVLLVLASGAVLTWSQSTDTVETFSPVSTLRGLPSVGTCFTFTDPNTIEPPFLVRVRPGDEMFWRVHNLSTKPIDVYLSGFESLRNTNPGMGQQPQSWLDKYSSIHVEAGSVGHLGVTLRGSVRPDSVRYKIFVRYEGKDHEVDPELVVEGYP